MFMADTSRGKQIFDNLIVGFSGVTAESIGMHA